jgi:PAS domain S-box-containing protein
LGADPALVGTETVKIGTRYAASFSILMLGLVGAVLGGAGLLGLRQTRILQRQIQETLVAAQTKDQRENLRGTARYLSTRLFNPLLRLDLRHVEEEIRQVRAWLPVVKFLVADSSGSVLTDGTGENAAFGERLPVDPRAPEAPPLVREVNGDTEVLFAIRSQDTLAGWGQVTFARDPARDSLRRLQEETGALWTEHRSSLLRLSLLVLLLTAVLGVLVTVRLSKTLAEPLAEASRAAKKFADGDLEFFLEPRSDDELGDLARALNAMARNLRADEVALRAERDLVSRLMETSPVGILRLDPSGRILFANPHAEATLRLSGAGDGNGYAGLPFRLRGPELDDEGREPFHGIAMLSSPVRGIERTAAWPDGRRAILSISSAPLFTPGGAPDGVVATVEDVTERRRDEQLQAALYRIAETATSAKSTVELYGEIHVIVAELMPARNFYIAMLDDEGFVSFPYFRDERDSWPRRKPLGKGLTEYVLRTSQPLLASPEVFADLERRGEVASIGSASMDWLGAPLRTGDKTIGVVAVQSYSEAVRYGEREKAILAFVSGQIAASVERKRADETLRSTLSVLKSTLESTADGILVVDRQGRVVSFNQRFAELWRVPQAILDTRDDEKLLQHAVDQLQDASGFRRLVEELYADPEREAFDVLKFRDGRIFERFSAPQRMDGRAVGRVWSFRDVTARERARGALADSERRLRAIIDAEPECVKLVGPDGTLLEMNRAGLAMIEADSPDQVIGKSVYALVAKSHRAAFLALTERVLRGGSGTLEFEITGLRGTHRWLESHAVPLRGERGRPVALLSVTRDVTARRQAEQERERLQETVRRSETMAALGTLLGGVAHEVRNPLFAISSNLDAFEARFGSREEFRGHVSVLRSQLERLSGLMEELLEYGRPFSRSLTPESLRSVVADALRGSRVEARRCGVRLQVGVPRELPKIPCERRRLSQVFQNVIANGVQHSGRGGLVWLDVDELRESRRALRVVIADSGPGFAEEDLSRIFEPFFSRRRGGTGLGLSIVQRIIEEHGGTIAAQNRPGGGGSVTITLPLAPGAASALPQA